MLATIFQHEIHITNTDLKTSHITNTLRSAEHCVKWNKAGDQFAFAVSGGRVLIWDANTFKVRNNFICCFEIQ